MDNIGWSYCRLQLNLFLFLKTSYLYLSGGHLGPTKLLTQILIDCFSFSLSKNSNYSKTSELLCNWFKEEQCWLIRLNCTGHMSLAFEKEKGLLPDSPDFDNFPDFWPDVMSGRALLKKCVSHKFSYGIEHFKKRFFYIILWTENSL